jgi:hypothetical protein
VWREFADKYINIMDANGLKEGEEEEEEEHEEEEEEAGRRNRLNFGGGGALRVSVSDKTAIRSADCQPLP